MATELRNGVGGSTPGQAAALRLLKDMWSAMVPTFRILCLSELNDVAPMWNHYADGYKGVVLEFFAVEDVDSAFQVARPVVYQDAPSIAEAGAWVNCMLREGNNRWQDLFMEYLYVKTPPWSYEREWRISMPGRRPKDSELFGDYGFHPRELTSIYFGPKCPDGERSDLLNLLSHGLEHVKVYEIDDPGPGNRRTIGTDAAPQTGDLASTGTPARSIAQVPSGGSSRSGGGSHSKDKPARLSQPVLTV